MLKGSLQIKNNIYQVVFYHNGKTIWRSTGVKAIRGNKRKAEQRMNEILSEYDDNPGMFDRVLFTDYIEKWLENVKYKVDVITYEGYEQYAQKHIIPYFKPLKLYLQNVKLEDIEGYYNYKSVSGRLDSKEGGLSYRTIKLHGIVLNLVFQFAMRNKLIKENPCTYAEIPRTAKRSEKITNFYTTKQCQTLLKNIEGTPLYDMVYLTFLYGLRRSELMGLKWSAINFNSSTLSICHTVVVNSSVVAKDTTKNKTSNRTYPLLDDVKKILYRIKSEQEANKKFLGNRYVDTDYVFVKENGETYYPSYPSRALRKIIKQNNLTPIRWHDLRHSCASMLILQGWQMKDISEWLGHADIGTTMDIYTHIGMDHKKELGKTLNGIL